MHLGFAEWPRLLLTAPLPGWCSQKVLVSEIRSDGRIAAAPGRFPTRNLADSRKARSHTSCCDVTLVTLGGHEP